jgi:hypothetical protein
MARINRFSVAEHERRRIMKTRLDFSTDLELISRCLIDDDEPVQYVEELLEVSDEVQEG